MTEEGLAPLPFFFRKIEDLNKYVLTNLAGSHAFVDSYDEVREIILGTCERIEPILKEELRAKSFIVSKAERPVRSSLIGSKFASLLNSNLVTPSLFLVVPTLRCDHNCQYCQVSRVPVSKNDYDLQVETIDKILEIIRSIPNNEIKIEFQGGEPLLAFPFIQSFVAKAKEKFKDRKVEFVICSALGPANDRILTWAQEHNIVISTSLDGPAYIHDANRPAKGIEPHRNTVKQIANIQSVLGSDKVGCLTTITNKSLDHPREIVEEYFGLGLNGIFLRPLSPFGFASQKRKDISYGSSKYFDFYKSALDCVIDLNEKRPFVEETTLIHLMKIFRPGISGFADLKSPSGYLMGAMVFNYDGRVFGSDEARMLWESTKADELVLGDLDSKASELLTNKYAVELLSDTFTCTSPGCDECAYQPFCGADPLFHLATQGDHIGDKSQSFFCQLERLTFDHLFTLYQSSAKARKVFDQWLVL